jgi:hypothetical protein
VVAGRRSGKSALFAGLDMHRSLEEELIRPAWTCDRCGCVVRWEYGPPPPHPVVGSTMSSGRFSAVLADVREDGIPECDMLAVSDVMES